MLDFDALWTSDKLGSCAESVRSEYVWVYGLADANGSFELNLRAIHSRVAAIRPRLTLRRLEAIFKEFEAHGLLFVWQENGKTYGHWTKSDVPGRLPKMSERHRYRKFAPAVPIEALAAYESRFHRDTLATASRPGVGVGLGLDRIGKGDGRAVGVGVGVGETEQHVANASEQSKPARENPPFRNTKLNGPFFCSYCRKNFSNANEYCKHHCKAQTAAGWECFECHETFADHIDLKRHIGSGCKAAS